MLELPKGPVWLNWFMTEFEKWVFDGQCLITGAHESRKNCILYDFSSRKHDLRLKLFEQVALHSAQCRFETMMVGHRPTYRQNFNVFTVRITDLEALAVWHVLSSLSNTYTTLVLSPGARGQHRLLFTQTGAFIEANFYKTIYRFLIISLIKTGHTI